MTAAGLGAGVVCAALVGVARAENRVAVRGQYYREPSTRVVQPVAEIAKDLPAGVDMGAHFLLDAITSASAAAGPDGDNIFTEYRNEAGLSAGKTWSRLRLGGAYKYSAESDYWSHTFVLNATLRTWGDTGTWAAAIGHGFDQVGRRIQGSAPTPAQTPGAPCSPSGARTCPLDSTFGGIGYSQVLSPTTLVQAGYEFNLLQGFLASPYRLVAGLGPEMVPDKRLRNVLSARFAQYFPRTNTGLQGHYRFYYDLYPGDLPMDAAPTAPVPGAPAAPGGDPWNVLSHTVELRAFQKLTDDLEARVTGRWYSQSPANFFCDQGVTPGCYVGRQLYTGDPKLQGVATWYVEGKLYWQATAWRGVPLLGWFSQGTLEVSYGFFLQNTAFANAHVLQTGYLLPF